MELKTKKFLIAMCPMAGGLSLHHAESGRTLYIADLDIRFCAEAAAAINKVAASFMEDEQNGA